MPCNPAFASAQILRLRTHPEFHFCDAERLKDMAKDLAACAQSEEHCEQMVDYWLRNNGADDPLPMLSNWRTVALDAPLFALQEPADTTCPTCHGQAYVMRYFLTTYRRGTYGSTRPRHNEPITEEAYGRLIAQGCPTSPAELRDGNQFCWQGSRPCLDCSAGRTIAARIAAERSKAA